MKVNDAPCAADAAEDECATRENRAANVKGDDREIAEDLRAQVGKLRDRRRRAALSPLRKRALEDVANGGFSVHARGLVGRFGEEKRRVVREVGNDRVGVEMG